MTGNKQSNNEFTNQSIDLKWWLRIYQYAIYTSAFVVFLSWFCFQKYMAFLPGSTKCKQYICKCKFWHYLPTFVKNLAQLPINYNHLISRRRSYIFNIHIFNSIIHFKTRKKHKSFLQWKIQKKLRNSIRYWWLTIRFT